MTLILATDPAIVAAVITASVSSLVALFSAGFSVVRIKKLERERAEGDAKIAYTYEARKRLYSVCEPLLFQAMEQAEEARVRICSLARSARQNQIRPDGSGWLGSSQVDEYYFKSTVYILLAPVTTFSILQRQLTTIDLTLDENVRRQYEVLKLVFFSFANDWDLAQCGEPGGSLEYDRDKTDIGEPERERFLEESPERYAPQGLYRGMIYLIAEALISKTGTASGVTEGPATPERCLTFGEFEREWTEVKRERDSTGGQVLWGVLPSRRGSPAMDQIFDGAVELFTGFHPARKPVLWRVLVFQYLLYRALLSGETRIAPLGEEEVKSLDWRVDGQGSDDFEEALRVGQEFASSELARVRTAFR